MSKQYALSILLAIILLGCGVNGFKLVINQNKYAVEIKILYSENCRSIDLYSDARASIQFYTLTSEFDFKRPDPYKFLTPNEEGKYFFDFFEGFYFYEIIAPNGTITFSGLFSYPDDLTAGKLCLARGRKTGIVREYLGKDEYGPFIADAEIIYRNEITGDEFIHYSDENGQICIELDAGRYTIEVNHPDYFSYIPPGELEVFSNYSNSFGDFFLERR